MDSSPIGCDGDTLHFAKHMFELRDPIHRTISFSEREKRIIDHPYVQRLRHVRQLGLASLVYPGATHDRFSHALGAMHVAGRLWARMTETSGDVLGMHFSQDDLAYFRQMVRFAGLLHDVGHPPFSHVAEKFMPRFDSLSIPSDWLEHPNQDRQATHEDFSVVLISGLAVDDRAPLSRDEAQDIASLVHHEVRPSAAWRKRFGDAKEGNQGIHRLLRSLISGELDCDRMDYLLRDAHFSGVAYGAHDIEHLIGNTGVMALAGGSLARTIDSTAVRAFEDFLLARYHMFLQVYMHKTAIAFDHFLERAIHTNELSLQIPGDAERYSRLRDSTLHERIYAAADDPTHVWSRRLVERVPPKMLLVVANAKPAERDLMQRAVKALDATKVPYFTLTSKQYLSKASFSADDSLLVRRKVLGRFVYDPIGRYSSLLVKYNEIIDLTHLYVLREDADDAGRALKTLAGEVSDGPMSERSIKPTNEPLPFV